MFGGQRWRVWRGNLSLTLGKAKQSGIKLPCGELEIMSQTENVHVVRNNGVLCYLNTLPDLNVGRKLIPVHECQQSLFLSQHRWLTTSSSLLFLTPHVWWLLQKCYTLGKFWGDSSLLRWHYTAHAVHGLSSIGTSISLSHWVTQRWYSSQKFAQWGVQYMAFWDFWAATWSY